jgi:hypothetical protein
MCIHICTCVHVCDMYARTHINISSYEELSHMPFTIFKTAHTHTKKMHMQYTQKNKYLHTYTATYDKLSPLAYAVHSVRDPYVSPYAHLSQWLAPLQTTLSGSAPSSVCTEDAKKSNLDLFPWIRGPFALKACLACALDLCV